MSDRDNATLGPPRDAATIAKVLVLLVGFSWGINWIAARIILTSLPPWTMRVTGIGFGALALFAAGYIGRIPMVIPRGQRRHVVIAGFFNVALFNVFSAYAQIGGTTSRAIVIAYSMPIWATLMARFVLGEKLNAVKLAALGLCAIGLTILIWPLAQAGWPMAALYALACALTWAVGTVHLKWTEFRAAPLAATGWQLVAGWLMLVPGMLIVEGVPHLWPLPAHVLAAMTYNSLIGMAFGYFAWFIVVERLPATTASLGSLLVPVVGVVGSAIILGERPDLTDIIGFATIFAAVACVLLQPNVRHTELPE